MAKAEMIGGPDHQKMVPIKRGQKKIIIQVDGKSYEFDIENRQILWNSGTEMPPKK